MILNTQRSYWLLLILILIAASGVAGLSMLGSSRPEPNVLLIVVDTLRADRLSCYGWRETTSPNIDRLAAEGVLVERMICQVPQTLPSFCTILTGSYPPSHGVRVNGLFALPEEATTMAECFKDEGYRTAAFIAGFPLDSSFGLDQGFESYEDEMRSSLPMEGLQKNPDGGVQWLGYQTECFENRADVVTEEALAWLERHREDPFFVMVHYFDPHHDYLPPERLRGVFDHPYAGEVAFVDEQVGRLLAELDAAGLADETLVVVTADHGECLGEFGRYFHQAHLSDAALHIPFVARLPGILPAGTRLSETCETVDIMPTILEVTGNDLISGLSGQSLTPLWEGTNSGRIAGGPPCYFETLYGKLEAETGVTRVGLLEGKRKFILSQRTNPSTGRIEEMLELYDLQSDPDELKNLAPSRPAEAQQARERLQRFLDRIPAGQAVVLTPDEESKEKLKRLGYF